MMKESLNKSTADNAGRGDVRKILVKSEETFLMADKVRLLIADDHQLFVEGFRRIVREVLGVEKITSCTNGRSAVEECMKDQFDIVFMDIQMPIMNGLDATRQIKILRPSVKVIIMSSFGDRTTVVKAMRSGADAYILKDDNPEEIDNSVRAIVKGLRYLSTALSPKVAFGEDGSLLFKDDPCVFNEGLLSSMEREVLRNMGMGYDNQEIALILNKDVRLVKSCVSNLVIKLDLKDASALAQFAGNLNIVTD